MRNSTDVNKQPVTVRAERSSDVESIRNVLEAAFGKALEADIVDGVRGSADWLPDGSLVAVGERGDIVGHVLVSRARVVADDGAATEIAVIGPVAVAPAVQRRGVGSELMHAAISASIARRLPVICLVGHPTYYPRFGFEPARQLGLRPPDEHWPEQAWMALRLPEWTSALRGVVAFPGAFDSAATG